MAMSMLACREDDGAFTGESPATDPAELASDAYAAFSITVPNGTFTKGTKAQGTDAGVAAEKLIKTLHVFIYDVQPPHYATLASFTTADGSLSQKSGSSTEWITTKSVKTKKVDKYIFAGVNLTAEILSQITSKGFGAFANREMAQTVAQLTSATDGFVMFNAAYPAVTPGANLFDSDTAASAAHLAIPVSRVVAKAAVFKGENFVINGGGQMTDIKYGWRNLNKQFYLVQAVVDNWIKDYNWDTYAPGDFTQGADTLVINENKVEASEFSYTTENAFKYEANKSVVDEATFLTIRGTFTPDQVIQYKAGGTTPPATGNDFEMADNSSRIGADFYVVPTDDGVSNYFADPAVAVAYADLCSKQAEGMPALTGSYDVTRHTFAGGKCYFHLFVNGDAVAPRAPYNIYRNQYYKVTIHSIQAPGDPSDNFDQGKPIVPGGWIGVDVVVNDWDLVEEDYDL